MIGKNKPREFWITNDKYKWSPTILEPVSNTCIPFEGAVHVVEISALTELQSKLDAQLQINVILDNAGKNQAKETDKFRRALINLKRNYKNAEKYAELESQVTELQEKYDELLQDHGTRETYLKASESTVSELRESHDVLTLTSSTLRDAFNQMKQQLEKSQTQVTELQSELDLAKRVCGEGNKAMALLESQLAETQALARELVEIVDKVQHFEDGEGPNHSCKTCALLAKAEQLLGAK